MFNNLEVLHLARGLAEHAAARQTVVSQNIANADTPGYRQRDIRPFSEIVGQGGPLDTLRRTRSGHLASQHGALAMESEVVRGARADPNGNSVSLEGEIMKAAQLRQQHDLALSIYKSGLSVLRTSLGRR